MICKYFTSLIQMTAFHDILYPCRSYMRPDTPHAVLTTRHCLAVGGHFFSHDTFGYTLRGLMKDHFFGRFRTNAEHASSGMVLFKLVKKYLDDHKDGDWQTSHRASVCSSYFIYDIANS
jgi:hypothetical protein